MRLYLNVVTGVLVSLLLVGCASAPMSGGALYDPNKPQVFLANADIGQAKGVAMGAAVTKGWKIIQGGDDTLILQRPLNAAAAESLSPGSSLATTPPVVEVRSQFFPRQGGVDVVLDAQAVVHRGTEEEHREDFTEAYRPELTRSLESLRIAWGESRQRIASAIPPLPAGQTTPEESSEETDVATIVEGDAAAPAVAAAPHQTRVDTAWGDSPAPETGGPAPVESRSVGLSAEPLTSVPETMTEPTASADPSSNMIALSDPPSVSTGVWAYYAEHYARMRGCQVAGQGALLLEKTPTYEQHRVYCEGGQTFLVKCNAGTCREVR